MKSIRRDIALLPVSGTYVMTAEEVAEAVAALRPKIAVPMHYAAIVGSARGGGFLTQRPLTDSRVAGPQT